MAAPYALDFSPLTQAIQTNQQNEFTRNKLAMEGERLGFERELQPFKVKEAQQGIDTRALEYEGNLSKRFGGLGQAILAAPDAAVKQQYTSQLAAHPGMKSMLDKHLPPGWESNPDLVGHFMSQVAQGYQDPEHQALIQAQTKQAAAEANKAGYMIGQPGTNIISIAPESQAGKSPGTVIASQPLKPPPGYESDPSKPGEYRPMQGGPADIKFTEAKNKALFSVQSSAAKIDDLVQNITELQQHPGLKGNFGVQGALPNFPGSQSSDAFAKLQQLKSQGGFAMLQAMRDASKTGGALGNVSDAEGARLEAAFGALQRASSLPQAMQELEKIKSQAVRSKGFLLGAYDRQYNAGTTPAQTPTRNAGGVGKPISDMTLDDLRKLSPMSMTPEQKKAAADRWDALIKLPSGTP